MGLLMHANRSITMHFFASAASPHEPRGAAAGGSAAAARARRDFFLIPRSSACMLKVGTCALGG